jgi:hypothetical protein
MAALKYWSQSVRNIIGKPVTGQLDSQSLKRTNGYAGSYLIDLNLWIDLLKIGPALHTTKTLMAFRIGASSWSYRLRQQQTSETIRFINYQRQSFPEYVSTFDKIFGISLALLKPKLRVFIVLITQRIQRASTP